MNSDAREPLIVPYRGGFARVEFLVRPNGEPAWLFLDEEPEPSEDERERIDALVQSELVWRQQAWRMAQDSKHRRESVTRFARRRHSPSGPGDAA